MSTKRAPNVSEVTSGIGTQIPLGAEQVVLTGEQTLYAGSQALRASLGSLQSEQLSPMQQLAHMTGLRAEQTRQYTIQRNKEKEVAEVTESRYLSGEVAHLDDIASLEIFGMSSRVLSSPDIRKHIPASGLPFKGKLEAIREQGLEALKPAKRAKKEAENNIRAEAYFAELEELGGQGFTLSQSKLIMDVRERRMQRYE